MTLSIGGMAAAEPRARAGAGSPADDPTLADVQAAVQRVWGHAELRPLQWEAIRAGIGGRDSLVVLPTGGGKSLCYQVPPLVSGRTDIVVSPLIALMKDQVDGLVANGYPAAALHGLQDAATQRAAEQAYLSGGLHLLFVAPERLFSPAFQDLLARGPLGAFAIDEAHCISQWGHDFRPEYRQLAELRQRYPGAAMHAFTATATRQVREDIVAQLALRDPALIVGPFDRPNLCYRVLPRLNRDAQILEQLRARPRQAAIVYCQTRAETESIAAMLQEAHVSAAAYHAGMDGHLRQEVQDAFLAERLDVVVATVAFGMGIDRSDVRLVLHAGAPKSIEHYQQETGRAGRDGLPADCVLLYSAADILRWDGILQRRLAEGELSADSLQGQRTALKAIQRYCSSPLCRHHSLAGHFGEAYGKAPCAACDVCLDELSYLPDGTVLAQKILSAVARTGGRFGVSHVVAVLAGAQTEGIRRWRHDQLTVYGLLKEQPRPLLTQLVYQLVDLGFLEQTEGERPVIALTEEGAELLRGRREARLLAPPAARSRPSQAEAASWEGVDSGLYEALRDLRGRLARERSLPAYLIFGDATLRELARLRPSGPAGFRAVKGVGERKAADLGPAFVERIASYCSEHGLALDAGPQPRPYPHDAPRAAPGNRRSAAAQAVRQQAFAAFAAGQDLPAVARAVDRAESTVWGYLHDYVAQEAPDSLAAWVPEELRQDIEGALARHGGGQLGPIFHALGGKASYEQIRVVAAWRSARGWN